MLCLLARVLLLLLLLLVVVALAVGECQLADHSAECWAPRPGRSHPCVGACGRQQPALGFPAVGACDLVPLRFLQWHSSWTPVMQAHAHIAIKNVSQQLHGCCTSMRSVSDKAKLTNAWPPSLSLPRHGRVCVYVCVCV